MAELAQKGGAQAKAGVSDRVAAALKEALLAAGVALLLSVPLLSHRTVEAWFALELRSRWPAVLIAVSMVFFGRLALRLFWWREGAGPSRLAAVFTPLSRRLSGLGKWLAPALLAAAVLLPFTPFANRYILELGILVITYVVLGWGLNVVVGLAGLLDLGYAAFYAVGAYSYALLAQHFGLSFWICLPLAGILAAFWGIILGFPVLRLRGDYLAIVTLAFGEIIRIVLINWQSLTGGPNGISGIPRPSFFGLEFKISGGFADYFGVPYSPMHRIIFLYYVIFALALVANHMTLRLRRLPIGRAWEALREDEIACRALGLNTTHTKLTAFAIGAFFGGIGGSFFATRQGFISPESFSFIESATILAIVVLGGMGSQMGVVVAALILIGGIELFRDLEIYRMLIFGLAMVAIMVLRPRGLVAWREPSIVLKTRKAIGTDFVKEGHG